MDYYTSPSGQMQDIAQQIWRWQTQRVTPCPQQPGCQHCWHPHVGAWAGTLPAPRHCCWCGVHEAPQHGPYAGGVHG